jgi:molecular chaperone GrpE
MDTHKDMDVNIPKPGRQAEVGPVGEGDRGCSKGNDDGAPNKCCCCTREDKDGPQASGKAAEADASEEAFVETTCEDDGDAISAELKRLARERDEWKSKAESLWDQFLRARAEMDNFRKRTERDIQQRISRGKSDLILSLLEVLDNFDRFLAAGEKDATANEDSGFAAFFKGVQLIQKQILDVLAREGVEPMESPVGKALDPHYHEAVFAQDGGGEHGTIVQEIQKGYMSNGKVLRPSRVKVIR